ncbi:DoxX family protein [Sulfitobacter aestuarii]|uniref:DoxX family protein n=1 Tax=Sulfitobacter aestuarii TaxID=2161676 RepID=A0ABW5U0A4_9RHOB
MNGVLSCYHEISARLEAANWLVPTLARLVFAAVLLVYFLNSGLTKLGDGTFGLFSPSAGAYAQIFPRQLEAAGYDPSALSIFHRLAVLGGTLSEFVLPVLIVLGLLTRLAALGMIGFVIVQSLTDFYGHGSALGAWFDRFADGTILDQRTLWLFLLCVLVIRGGGPLSLDRLLGKV